MDIVELKAVLEETSKAVLEAGKIISENWKKPKQIKMKGRIDIVTDTDLAVEKFLKDRLSVILPESDFLAEETSGSARPGKLTWIIDPVDGTTNFTHGLPMVATSVALWADDKIVLGVVNLPILGEIFTAVRGGGTRLNGVRVSTTETGDLEKSLIATGFPYDIDNYAEAVTKRLYKVLLATRGIRRPGAAAMDLAYLSCGRYDGFYENGLKPWDTAAGWLLVEEAGGCVTDFEGNPYNLYSPSILASNTQLHEKLSGLINEE
ncbi:inositol monophosphatase family protein [Maridesulfovibrio bastinii]|uniref:inositol monophosphatase family protein n=1 Tax=Maridesulfovibrio bastinii TaxID=47157 RepID=UPI0004016C96|nr:inositol monophosphatase family protein [Maridesulfovibrio bastinii]